MRITSTTAHGMLGYLAGIQLMLSPWTFGYAGAMPETIISLAAGELMIIYSLLTAYEFGLVPVISLKAHLALDIVFGIFLSLSPWIAGFRGNAMLPLMIIGGISIAAPLLTISLNKDPGLAHRSNRQVSLPNI